MTATATTAVIFVPTLATPAPGSTAATAPLQTWTEGKQG